MTSPMSKIFGILVVEYQSSAGIGRGGGFEVWGRSRLRLDLDKVQQGRMQ
jgi:hypothetical protein